MHTFQVNPFFLIGIAVRTTNENGQAAIDIPQLWQRFMQENIAAQIPNKIEATVYSVYTDYELDFTKPYTTILGCRVENLDTVPDGMVGKTIAGGPYQTFTAKGSLADGIVYQEWTKVWASDLPRAYTADFEIYGEKALDPENAEVDILIAVN